MRLSPSNAKTVRTTGILLTLAGLAVNVSGAAALAGNMPSLNDEFGVGVGRFAPGGVPSGAGVGLWAYGDVEARRAEGTAWMLTAERRSERGHALKIPGIVVTTLGLAFAAASFIPLGVPTHCQNRSNEDGCGLENFIAATALGSTSSVFLGLPRSSSGFLGLGIPLLAIGISEEHKGAVVTIDRIAPKAMPGGGGIGFSGRF